MVLCWNVWSILNEDKLSNVLQILEDKKIQIACICETWFDSEKGKFTTAIKEAGYEIAHGFRENKRGGGAAILYHKNLSCKKGEASSSKFSSFEFSSVTLVTSDKAKLLLVCVYRKQEISCKVFCDEMEDFLDRSFHKGDIVVVVGDFNVWIETNGDADAERLRNLMNSYGLSQHRRTHSQTRAYIGSYIY